MIDLQQADLELEKIYHIIKQQRDGILLDDIAKRYPSRDATVPYVVAQLLASGKVKTVQRGEKVFCMVVEMNNANNFEQYLQQYNINPVRLAGVAGVRYLTVYNAQKGNPITYENARKIREAVLKLTGVAYTGSFLLVQVFPAERGTFPAEKLHKG